jgi:hypothetical protein
VVHSAAEAATFSFPTYKSKLCGLHSCQVCRAPGSPLSSLSSHINYHNNPLVTGGLSCLLSTAWTSHRLPHAVQCVTLPVLLRQAGRMPKG